MDGFEFIELIAGCETTKRQKKISIAKFILIIFLPYFIIFAIGFIL